MGYGIFKQFRYKRVNIYDIQQALAIFDTPYYKVFQNLKIGQTSQSNIRLVSVLGEFTESFLRDWSPDHYKIKLGNTFFND
jgi:hypothetical protein